MEDLVPGEMYTGLFDFSVTTEPRFSSRCVHVLKVNTPFMFLKILPAEGGKAYVHVLTSKGLGYVFLVNESDFKPWPQTI